MLPWSTIFSNTTQLFPVTWIVCGQSYILYGHERSYQDWLEIASDLTTVSGLTVRWCYFSQSVAQTVLHSLADTSLKDYGAVVFVTQGKEVAFIMAKSHVAPLKQLTLLCLQLMATLVPSRPTCIVMTSRYFCFCLVGQSDCATLGEEPEATSCVCSQSYNRDKITVTNYWVENFSHLWAFSRLAHQGNHYWCNDLIVTMAEWNSLDHYTWQMAFLWSTKSAIVPAVATKFVPTEPDALPVGLHCIISLDHLCKFLRVTAYVRVCKLKNRCLQNNLQSIVMCWGRSN